MRYSLAICLGLALCFSMSVGVTPAAALLSPSPLPPVMGNQGKGHGNHGADKEHGNSDHGRDHYKQRERRRVAFSAHQREVVRDYFREYPSQLPPGLAKRGGDLPPGLEKHLREGGTLPPGLEKRLRPCPAGLSRRLPPLPAGYSRVMLGARLLILNRARVVMDIMFLAR